MGSPNFFFGATFSILLITADLEMVETKLDFEKKFEIQSSLIVTIFLIHTFASFHYGHLKNTLILTVF